MTMVFAAFCQDVRRNVRFAIKECISVNFGAFSIKVQTLSHIVTVERFGAVFNRIQAGIATDRYRTGLHQFHTIVINRIVAGGDFDSAINAKVFGREVNFFGTRHANISDFCAAINKASTECQFQRCGSETNITAHYHRFSRQFFCKSKTNPVSDLFVKLSV